MKRRLLRIASVIAISLMTPGFALSQDPQSPEAVRRQNRQQSRGSTTAGRSTSQRAPQSPEATSPDPQSPEAVKTTTSKATNSVRNARGHRPRGRKRSTHKRVQS